MATQNFDAVVIGAGAGGGACAWALARAGVKVLLLDAGPEFKPEQDYRQHLPDWEQSRFPLGKNQSKVSLVTQQALDERWKHLRSWNRSRGLSNPTEKRQMGGYHHVRGIGGSTLHFTGEAHRLNSTAMRLQSEFGVGADWPLSYDELEPYYCQVEELIGVAGPNEVAGRPRSRPMPFAPHALGYAGRTLGKACRVLGLSWQGNSMAILPQAYDGRPACNYCGQCNRGCPRRDKGSVDVSFIRQARESGNCTIRPNSYVHNIEGGPGDRVQAVHFTDAQGNQQRIEAKVICLAAGAVDTPRLLLSSRNRYSPQGLSNDDGQVGKHFLETLFWHSAGLHPDLLGSHRGIPADGICWDFNAPDAIPGVIGGCRFNHGTLEADFAGPINYAKRALGGWGKSHKKQMREQFGHALGIGAIGEFLPNEQTYIDLDPNQTDDFGLPLARIHSQLSEMDLKRLEFMATHCRRILEAAGVEELFEEYGTYDFFQSTHVFGTCRMGSNPETSVVDAYGRSHRWRNLFIVDASTFPSSGGGESPSLSIEALALRSAERIGHLATQRKL